MMGSRLYTGPQIAFTRPGEQTWWFTHRDWQPGDWIRASAHFLRANAYGGDFIYENDVDYRSTVEIVREWSDTNTHISVPPGGGSGTPGRPNITHWVTFAVPRDSRNGYMLPKFLVVN